MVEKFMKVIVAAGLATGVLAAGCLTRPVVSQNPTTKTSFQSQVKQQSIDKVDLLFAIDNSASMGDKQSLLALAVPVLVNRLLNPNCVDADTSHTCKQASDCSALGNGAQCDTTGNNGAGQCFVAGDSQIGDKQCTTIPGTKAEFAPVHDMHVGIVSSALGSGGLTSSTDPCVISGTTDPTHQNDNGHLLNRTYDSTSNGDGPAINSAKPTDGNGGNFLAWLPSSDPKNANKSPPNVTPYGDGSATSSQLDQDFASLVVGVQQHGCGLEAQLESWYHFLIQPDPWQNLTPTGDSPPRVKLDGIDATLLKMRHDFLRPDSLVAIIQITDEEDSWSDPLWDGDPNSGGFGWVVRTQNTNLIGGPGSGVGPRGTSACDAPVNVNTQPPTGGPNDPACQSCAFSGAGTDPNCSSCVGGATGCQPGWYNPASQSTPIAAADGLNIRYGEQYMKPRYGFDPQFPVQRYIDGLRSPKVPDSANESHNWPDWTPNKNCTNPLFAENLPDGSDTSSGALCDLTPGSRTSDLVFYALIGGVPNSLVDDANGNLKLNLNGDDWTKILGKDPDHFVFDGIDPHMIESDAPRQGLPTPGSTYNLGSDPDNGREWNTLTSNAQIDLQYACTFDLPQAKDCTAAANNGACDCVSPATSTADGPPLCDIANRSSQIKGKAYPTIRELRVAKGLAQQAVVSSLCAKVVSGSNIAPDFGYNPAMQAIVNRLKSALSGQCLPETLTRDPNNGTVPCLVLVVYPNQTDQAAGCTDNGMSQPTPDIIQRFDEQYLAQLGDAGGSTTPPVVCEFKQLTPNVDYSGATCDGQSNIGWCYVEGSANTGGCPQAVKFGGGGPPAGTTIDLECIEQSAVGGDQ